MSDRHRRGGRRRRSGRARGQPRAHAGGRCPRRAREGPGRTDVAGALGQLLPGHTELERAAPRPPLRRRDPDGFMPATRSSRTSSATRQGSRRRCGRASRSPRCEPGPDGGFLLETSAGRLAAHDGGPRAPAHTSGRTDRRRGHAPRGPASDRRRGLPQPGGSACRPGAGGRQRPVRAARSPRSSTRPAARSSWPAGELRGSPAGSATTTSSGGRSRRASSTRRSARLPSPAARLAANVQATGRAAATTSTTDAAASWASPCSATSSAPRAATPASRPTSARASPGAISGTRSSWIWSGSWSPSADCRGRRSPSRSRSTPKHPSELNLSGFGAVVFAGGFRPDYESWVRCPGAFDELGFPIHEEGASTVARGLYFVGVHFLRKRKSSLFIGVGEDAAIVARQIAAERPPAGG